MSIIDLSSFISVQLFYNRTLNSIYCKCVYKSEKMYS